jgi:hypothetical protein
MKDVFKITAGMTLFYFAVFYMVSMLARGPQMAPGAQYHIGGGCTRVELNSK